MTLAERLQQVRTDLVRAGISEQEASVDADVLVRGVLGWDRARLLSEQREPMPLGLEPRLTNWIARRSRREPTAYILGTREFWGLPFRVDASVLIPRPESELLIEKALPLLRQMTRPRIADVGTGSGCLAIALAHEIDSCTIIATDISADALALARVNAETHAVAARITFVQTSILDGVPGPFDLLVSNPPYVRSGDQPALGKEVRYEPEVALFGGADGLRAIEHVLDAALDCLAHGGWMLMEFGYNQEDDVESLVNARPGLALDAVHADLQGIPRVSVIRRH